MRLIAKAAFGALALVSLATVSATPASAARVIVQYGTPNVVIERHDPCLRPPAFRPAFCFRHHGMGWGPMAFNDRDRFMRDRMFREHERERERQAFLEHRYRDWEMNR